MDFHIAETIIGIGLTVLGVGFTYWGKRVSELTSLFRDFAEDFHRYQLDTEKRLSYLESKVNGR